MASGRLMPPPIPLSQKRQANEVYRQRNGTRLPASPPPVAPKRPTTLNRNEEQSFPPPRPNFSVKPDQSSTSRALKEPESKENLRVVTTSIESCLSWHRKLDYHPAYLLFKTYGSLMSHPELPGRCPNKTQFVMFVLLDERSRTKLWCYFVESERRLPDLRPGETYSVVGRFLEEKSIGDFQVFTVYTAKADNGIRRNLFNYNDQKLKKYLCS